MHEGAAPSYTNYYCRNTSIKQITSHTMQFASFVKSEKRSHKEFVLINIDNPAPPHPIDLITLYTQTIFSCLHDHHTIFKYEIIQIIHNKKRLHMEAFLVMSLSQYYIEEPDAIRYSTM